MLLPSPVRCDSSHANNSRTRLQSSSLFASPPLSPPSSSYSHSQSAISGLFTSCRALQAMLSPSPQPSQLPSPPTSHSEIGSPIKMRLRTRKNVDELLPRKKITKRATAAPAPPRGINKRRRELDDEMDYDTNESDGESLESSSFADATMRPSTPIPSTPKRLRLAPPVLPLGLERSDFHTLDPEPSAHSGDVLPSIEDGEDTWTTEDDRMLVEMVLEKLKLSKSEWQDCARGLGRDRSSVGKRWKSLMGSGDIGLKNRQRRTKLHGSWR